MYHDLSEEEKDQKPTVWSCNIKNLSEDEKQRLVEWRKNYSKTWKNKTTSQLRIINLFSVASVDSGRAVSEHIKHT